MSVAGFKRMARFFARGTECSDEDLEGWTITLTRLHNGYWRWEACNRGPTATLLTDHSLGFQTEELALAAAKRDIRAYLYVPIERVYEY